MNERSIFMAALERETPAERSGYLAAACGGDATLRQRVEALLRSHEQAGSFLGQPAPERLAAALANQAESGGTQGETPAHDVERDALEFLVPADKPGVLGRLGHYEVLEVIGRGGMGIVLRAFDDKLHRVVAIKVMAPQWASNATARKRFVREAQAAAAVHHEHVIDIHAVEEAPPPGGEGGGMPYLVMEYVAGQSLQERLDRSGPLAVKEILRIGMQTGAGLAAAHAQGLVHRDVTPANILLENGVERVKITDFGLARAVDDASGISQSGIVVGTPQYMSPEQARAEPVDHRSDLFSLGSVLYAMCTGRAPFRAASTVAILRRVCEDVTRPIREINPDVPDWLVAIVDRLHAKEPADRYQTAGEVAGVLGQQLARLQQPVMPMATTPPVSPPSQGEEKTPRVAGAEAWQRVAGAEALRSPGQWLPSPLGGRGAGGEGLAGASKTQPRPPTGDAPLLASKPWHTRRWAAAAAVLLVVFAGLGFTEVIGVTKVTEFVATTLRITTPEGTLFVEVDDPNVKVTIEGDGGLVITGAGPQEVRLKPGSYKLQATKDGKPIKTEVVTIARGDKKVVTISVEPPQQPSVALPVKPSPRSPLDQLDPAKIPAEERFAWQPKELVAVLGEHRGRYWGPVYSVALSPDGKVLAGGGIGSGGDVVLWDPETLRERGRLKGHSSYVQSVAFAGDSRRLVSLGADDKLLVWDVEAGKTVRSFEARRVTSNVAISPDGRLALAGDLDKLVRLWDLEGGGEHLLRRAGHADQVTRVAFSPDGQLAASGSRDGIILLWDLKAGKELRRFQGHTGEISALTFSPDGRRLLSGNGFRYKAGKNEPPADYHLRLWDVESGQEIRRFEGHTQWVGCLAFSPDGSLALSGETQNGRDLRLWEVESGRMIARLEGHLAGVISAGFFPDPPGAGRAFSGSYDGRVRLWDTKTGQELSRPSKGHPSRALSLAFSPDGRFLLSGGAFDKYPRLWDTATGTDLRRIESNPPRPGHHRVVWLPDGRSVLAITQDGQLQLAEVATGKELRRLPGLPVTGRSEIRSLAVTPDGRYALTPGLKAVYLWDLQTGKVSPRFEGHTAYVTSVAVSPDGRQALSGGDDKTLRLWDLDSGREQVRFEGGTYPVRSVAFAPDGRWVAAGEAHGAVRLWDVAQPERPVFSQSHSGGYDSTVNAVAFAPDGKTLASAGEDGRIMFWAVPAGMKLREWRLPGDVNALAFAPDGRHLATANSNGTIYILRLEGLKDTGQGAAEIAVFPCGTSRLVAAAFSSDGRQVLSVPHTGKVQLWDPNRGGDPVLFQARSSVLRMAISPDRSRFLLSNAQNPTLRLWEWESGRQVVSLEGHTELVDALALSGDGRRAVSGSRDQTVRLWNLETGKEVKRFEGHSGHVSSVALSPDGRRILSAGFDRTVRLWDVESRKELHRQDWSPPVGQESNPPVGNVTFLPDGKRALFSRGAELLLWDLDKGSVQPHFKGHRDSVMSVAVSPDGRRVLSGGSLGDKTARLWDLETGRELHRFELDGPVVSVAFSPEGDRAVFGSDTLRGAEAKVHVWRLPPRLD